MAKIKLKDDAAAMLFMLTACVFLVVGLVLGVLVAHKFVVPSLGQGAAALSYGRLRMAHTNGVMFAFLLQADIGLILYILPRLLHTRLFSQRLALVQWALYNLALLGAVAGFLLGHNKMVEYGEAAFPFDVMIFVSWALFVVNLIGTVARRRVKYLYVSVWYIVGTGIWTVFVYFVGNFATQMTTGINQANLQWFYVHNAVGLVFTPAGLAIAYYLIPKELNTPLYSHKLSLIGFWSISFVYVWTGAHHMIYGPVSYWLQTVAILFSWSLLIPVLTVITNFFMTFAKAPSRSRFDGAVAKFLFAGTVWYLLTCLQGPLHSIRMVNRLVSKTDWIVGHAHMALLGGFGSFAFAGLYYAIPRIMGRPLFSRRLGNLHFWITQLLFVPFFFGLFAAGVKQGLAWMEVENTFVATLHAIRSYHSMRLAVGALLLFSQFVFLYNIWETILGKKTAPPPDAGEDAV